MSTTKTEPLTEVEERELLANMLSAQTSASFEERLLATQFISLLSDLDATRAALGAAESALEHKDDALQAAVRQMGVFQEQLAAATQRSEKAERDWFKMSESQMRWQRERESAEQRAERAEAERDEAEKSLLRMHDATKGMRLPFLTSALDDAYRTLHKDCLAEARRLESDRDAERWASRYREALEEADRRVRAHTMPYQWPEFIEAALASNEVSADSPPPEPAPTVDPPQVRIPHGHYGCSMCAANEVPAPHAPSQPTRCS